MQPRKTALPAVFSHIERKGELLMDLGKLLESGKSKEEILAAVGSAIDEMQPQPEAAPEPTPTPASDDPLKAILNRLDQLEEKINQSAPEPEPNSEPKPEGIGEEAVNKILQQLNLLSENDKIDSNQQIENNLTKHFGSLIGVDIDTGKE